MRHSGVHFFAVFFTMDMYLSTLFFTSMRFSQNVGAHVYCHLGPVSSKDIIYDSLHKQRAFLIVCFFSLTNTRTKPPQTTSKSRHRSARSHGSRLRRAAPLLVLPHRESLPVQDSVGECSCCHCPDDLCDAHQAARYCPGHLRGSCSRDPTSNCWSCAPCWAVDGKEGRHCWDRDGWKWGHGMPTMCVGPSLSRGARSASERKQWSLPQWATRRTALLHTLLAMG